MLKQTVEQSEIIEVANSGVNLKINALAGSGKSTTLAMISHEFDALGKTGMYLAFNKSIATEAKEKMAMSCECRTAHSLAYSKTDRSLIKKLSYKPLSNYVLAKKYDIAKKFFTDTCGMKRCFSAITQVTMIKNTIVHWCNSADEKLERKHLATGSWMDDHVPDGVRKDVDDLVFKCAKEFLAEMLDVSGNVAITHDLYLKLFTLSKKCKLKVDYLMIDEAQDLNPCLLDFISKQKCQIICVGDHYQSIYQWRGAVNAMQLIESDVTKHLTQSFRFGGDIVTKANTVLKWAGFEKDLIGTDKDFTPNENIDCYIARSNLGALGTYFNLLENGKKPHIAFDLTDVKRFVNHWDCIKSGIECKQPHHLLGSFMHEAVVMSYIKETKDVDLARCVSIAEEYGHLIIDENHKTHSEDESDCMVITAHKSKGLEWNTVALVDDFNMFNDKDEPIETVGEVNLVYVAMTRAKQELLVNPTVSLWLDVIQEKMNEIK